MTDDRDTTDTLPFFKEQINVGLHLVEAELGSFYTETTRTDTTVASQTAYQSPDDCVRIKDVYVTVGTVQYPAKEIFNEDEWRDIQSNTQSSTSDFLRYFFARYDTYELYPEPATAGNTITVTYERANRDLYNDDYTTGTITTLANAGTAVTGDGTTFTAGMVGRFFKIDAYPVWYEISAYTSATGITLKKKYQGTAIAAGSSAFTIGEMPRIPPSTHILPAHYALWQYFLGFKTDGEKSKDYRDMFLGLGRYEGIGLAAAKATYGRRYSTTYINGKRQRLINPNNFPLNMS